MQTCMIHVFHIIVAAAQSSAAVTGAKNRFFVCGINEKSAGRAGA
jgi:hypothetical protein